MNSLTAFKLTVPDGLDREYEVAFDIVPIDSQNDSLRNEIESALKDLDAKIDDCHTQIDELNQQIDFYTSHTDKIDVIISATSGILTATLDAVLKEMRLKKTLGGNLADKDLLDFLNADGSNSVNKFIENLTDSETLKKAVDKSIEKGNSSVETDKIKDESLKGIINFLEDRFNIPGDSLTKEFGCSRQHHLRDFSHHPSIVGLIFSMITQFTMKCYGTDTDGKFIIEPLKFIDGKESKIAKGKKEIKIIGDTIGEKILFGTIFWFFHLVSDMAGSSNTPGAGMGIPGPILSFAKELSALPIFRKMNEDKNKEFSVWISKLYNGTAFSKTENGKKIYRKIDLRTEVGVFKELGKEAIPVLLNEFIVRSFYFIRRLVDEIKTKNIRSFSDLHLIDSDKVLPFKNRTVIRMLTIATGSFTATNLTAAAAVGAVKSGGNAAKFVSGFVMRINFVGIGRFAVAVGSDISGGIKKSKAEKGKFTAEEKLIRLTNAKVCYLNADALQTISSIESNLTDVFDAEERMWIAAKDANEAICGMVQTAILSGKYLVESCEEISNNIEKIEAHVQTIEQNNPRFKREFKKMLW